MCTSLGQGTLLNLIGGTSVAWTQYRFNITATSAFHCLMFGFQNEINRAYYLDNVSVFAIHSPSIEVLVNSNFENSTTTPTGWTQWFTSSCGGFPGNISTSINCLSGNCFVDKGRVSSGIDFVGQTFSTTIGQPYTVSFMLILGESGIATNNAFYLDIL